MFTSRLIRESDALTMLETFAHLIRRHGVPSSPVVPSPLQRKPGIEAIMFDPESGVSVYDWARTSLSAVMEATERPTARMNLIASRSSYPQQPGLLSFDPDRAAEPGHFVSRIVLELVESLLADFRPDGPLDAHRNAVARLTACAFIRQGFVLCHCLPALVDELSDYGVSQRFVETVLTSAACLSLTVCRQVPEQAVATYGMIMPRSVRRKIRPAFRQWDAFETEVKLLRVLPRAGSMPSEPSGSSAPSAPGSKTANAIRDKDRRPLQRRRA